MFVTFEGVDGSGKSTQARLLQEHLTGLGREVVATREPGGTELGERVRELVLNGPQMAAWAEAALFAASRAEHAAEVIRAGPRPRGRRRFRPLSSTRRLPTRASRAASVSTVSSSST